MLQDIAGRIAVAGQLTSTAAYQIYRAQQLGLSRKEIEDKLQKILGVRRRELEKRIRQAVEVGYDFDISNLPKEAIPFAANESAQQMVGAAVKLAKDDFTNLTRCLAWLTRRV